MRHLSPIFAGRASLSIFGELRTLAGGRSRQRHSSLKPPASRGDPPGSGIPSTAHALGHAALAEPAIPWSVTDPPPRALDPPGGREPSGAPPGRLTSRGDPPGSGSPPTAHALGHVALAEPAIPWSVTDPPPRALDPPGREAPSGSPPVRVTSRGDPPGDTGIPIHSLSAERRWVTLPVPDRKRCGRKPPEHCKPKSRKIRPWL